MSWTYLYIFLQSNLLEVPFYHLFFKKSQTPFETLTYSTAINSLTHPIVFFVIMNLQGTYLENILLAESFAILAETLFFAKILKKGFLRSFFAALVANLVSWQVAPMMTYYLFK